MTHTNRPTPGPPIGEPVRARSTALCIGGALLMGLLSLVFVPSLIGQISSIDPNSVSHQERRQRNAIMDAAVRAQRTGLVVHQAIEEHYRTPGLNADFGPLQPLDPQNGIYSYLTLLAYLRTYRPGDGLGLGTARHTAAGSSRGIGSRLRSSSTTRRCKWRSMQGSCVTD